MKKGVLLIVGLISILGSLLAYAFCPRKRPFLTESDWTTHKTPWWQLYYSSKYLSPVKLPARHSGLKELFSAHMGPDPDRVPLADQQTFSISTVGDLMCRRDLAGEGSAHLWEDIGGDVFSGDLCIGNFEFVVNANWIIEKLVRFSVPPSYAEPLLGDSRFGKFQLVSLANNHINDSYSGGIISTCDFLDSRGVKHVGANREPDDQDNFPILEFGGSKIAVLSYTFSTNGLPLEPHFAHGTNLVRFNALDTCDYDPSIIYRHIELAKKRGADFIVACNHWGVEFEYYPPSRLVTRAHELLDAGIDLIIGHHPHIVNPIERYKTKDGRSGVIFYSLGNLTSWGLKFTMQKVSLHASIDLETGTDADGKKVVRIGEIAVMPVIHAMWKQDGQMTHRLLPLMQTAEKIRKQEQEPWLSPLWARRILAAEREYLRHFRQNGITYR